MTLQTIGAADTGFAALRFLWVPILAALVSAVTAFLVSSRTIRANRDMARKRATLDMIERSESNAFYLSIYAAFRDVITSADGFAEITTSQLPAIMEQRRKVIAFLNHYELVAIGIEQGILDEELYRMFLRGTLVRHWDSAEAFVNHLRADTPDSNAPVAFEKFEALARSWETGVERKKRLERADQNIT